MVGWAYFRLKSDFLFGFFVFGNVILWNGWVLWVIVGRGCDEEAGMEGVWRCCGDLCGRGKGLW